MADFYPSRTSRRNLLTNLGAVCLGMSGSGRLLSDTPSPTEVIEEVEFPAMGSLINIRWESHSSIQFQPKEIRTKAMELVEAWNNILSDYDEDSEISTLAKRADEGTWQTVSPELSLVMQSASQWYERSEGAFDVAIGSITSLRRKRKLPPRETWEAAHERSGWKHVEWNVSRSQFRLLKPGVRFDFGGIGKGFVADRLHDLMKSHSIDRFIVNASGNLRVGDAPTNREGWPVAIDSLSPKDEPSKRLFALRLSQCAIATSGDQWQKLPDAQSQSLTERTSHILDPRTGYGISPPQSVSILARHAADADAAATATCVHLLRPDSNWLRKLESFAEGYCGVVQTLKDGLPTAEAFGAFDSQFGIKR
jgi:thiamine biosynthesis lipoprotein